jgi:autotransporter translocation and assembly factor TamB
MVKDTPFELGAELLTSDWREFRADMSLSSSGYGEAKGNGIVSADSVEFEAVVDNIDLKLIGGLSPSIDRIEGILNARIRIAGDPGHPRIQGGLRLRSLTLESPEFSPALVGGLAVIDFEGNTVCVDSVSFSLGKGYVFVSGSFDHQERSLAEVGINILIRDLEFERPGMAEVTVQSGDLRYSGAPGKYLLAGDLVMGETRFVMNFDPRSILPFARSVRRPAQELPEPLASTSMDITVRDSKDLWVDNNVARIRSHAELEIVGNLSQLAVTGRAAVEEGYVMFLDRKFEIRTGTVDFVERERLNPIIDLRAQSEVKTYRALKTETYTVNLDISGPLDEIRVTLTSAPSLDRANILSLLTLGVTREELVGGGSESNGSGAGNALKTRTEELTTRMVSGLVTRNVADMIGLKELSIEGNLFRRDQARGARLVASRGISERVDVTYSTNIGDFNENRVRMEYRLSDRLILQGETDQQGKAAIDLKYRMRFR